MFELIFLGIFGIVFVIIGYLIWKKQKITLIHDYHYTKVREEDKPKYTEGMGKGVVVMGLGILVTGIVQWATSSLYSWVFFFVGFIGGMIMILIAQKKYNGGLF